jgi:hypothetical protein
MDLRAVADGRYDGHGGPPAQLDGPTTSLVASATQGGGPSGLQPSCRHSQKESSQWEAMREVS